MQGRQRTELKLSPEARRWYFFHSQKGPMFAPIVICNGIFRSGSTWSFNVCRELVQQAAKEMGQPFASTYLDRSETEYFMMTRAATAPGPIVIKGVLTGEDARRAVGEGASAIVVSNHGGRQLDGAPAALRALPEVVAAVNGRAEVLMDGGIRRGSDIIKAICLGARAVLVGRAYAYGLAAAGQAGVARALEILRADTERTLRLLGCPSVAALDSSYVDVPENWQRKIRG